jgi:hypothetical protein
LKRQRNGPRFEKCDRRGQNDERENSSGAGLASVRKQDRTWLIGLAMVLAFASFVSQVPHVEASTTLAIDGSGNGSSVGGNCIWSQKLTTLNKPDVIVAMLAINDTTTTVTSPSDTASLSWTLRASQKGPGNVQVIYYYAIASAPLSADSITFGLSSAAVATVCLDFSVSGADTNAPFDPNAGMPNKNSGLSTTATLKYNTSNPNDLLIVLEGFCAQGAAGSGSPSGFTLVNAGNVRSSSNCPADGFQSVTYSEIVSTTLSSSTVSWPFDIADSPFAVIGDAIQSPPGPLSASVTASSNAVDVGQLASFSCKGAGGLSPYTYFWTFGDGATGSEASTSHIYNTPGTMNVICTVTDLLGASKSDGTQLMVSADPSIISFTASSNSLSAGDKVTLSVSASGGYDPLTYSYANLPPGCLSVNATSLSCYPTSSGNYRVTVTVTDRAMESANATAIITVGPQRVLGLPQAIGLAVIIGAIAGTGGVVVLSVAIALRRKKGHQAPAKA